MAIKKLGFALAAAGLVIGTSAQAAAIPARTGADVAANEELAGGDFLPFAVFIAAILATVIVLASDDDMPESP